jgi:hypothetical protein
LTPYRALDNLSGVGLSLTVPVEIAFAEGNAAHTEQLFDESEKLLRAAGSRRNPAANLSIRVVTTAMRGNRAQSIALPRESLALALRPHDIQIAAYSREGLAGSSEMLGRSTRRSTLRRTGSVARATRIRDRTHHLARASPLSILVPASPHEKSYKSRVFSVLGLANPRQRPPRA